MQPKSDARLLREHAETEADQSFAEIVNRHTNLVYSAALRQVESPDIAAEISQKVFIDLARRAVTLSRELASEASLAGWLCRSARNLALNHRRDEFRRQSHERQAMEHFASPSDVPVDWERLRPVLDDAMSELSEPDYDALVLRFFNNQDLRAVGLALGVSDDTAQKRVSRALDKLRDHLGRRGIRTSAVTLSVVLAAHAVQAAPVGLAAAISAAVPLAGATAASTATVTAAKAIAMTTLQKSLVTVTIAVLAGAGLYEARQAAQLRHQNRTLKQQQAPLADQVRHLQRERDAASSQLAALNEELTRLKSGQKQAELLRLRGNVTALQHQLATSGSKADAPAGGFAKMMNDPAMKEYIRVAMQDLIKRRYGAFFQELKLTPEQIDQFIQLTSSRFTQSAHRLAAAQQPGAGAAELARNDADEDGELGQQLMALLGERGMARFKEYSQEVPARTTVDLLNVQLGGAKLTDEQSARLFQVVKAEPFELTHGIAGDPDKAFFGSQTDIDNHLRKVDESNQRVLRQAGDFLNPDQLTALNTVLTNAINARIAQGAAFSPKR